MALYKLYKAENIDSKLMWFVFIIFLPVFGALSLLIKLHREKRKLEPKNIS